LNPSFSCTHEDVTRLVHGFYERARSDDLLGPIFAAHVQDWPHHLDKMVDFWSSILQGSGRYQGSPMLAHARLAGVQELHFQRWLQLFRQTTEQLGKPGLRAHADEIAQRIAQSLWYGYQIKTQPDQLPAALTLRPGAGRPGQARSV